MAALVLTTDELLSRPDLVAVDGVLYDVRAFAAVHPGPCPPPLTPGLSAPGAGGGDHWVGSRKNPRENENPRSRGEGESLNLPTFVFVNPSRVPGSTVVPMSQLGQRRPMEGNGRPLL